MTQPSAAAAPTITPSINKTMTRLEARLLSETLYSFTAINRKAAQPTIDASQAERCLIAFLPVAFKGSYPNQSFEL